MSSNKSIAGKRYYLTIPFRNPPFIESHTLTQTINVLFYLTLLLLDKLKNGTFYKFKLDPNYSFKVIEAEDRMDVTLADKNITTRHFVHLNYKVAVYDYRVNKHEDYFYNTKVDREYGSCKRVLFYNVKDLIEDLEILAEIRHISNMYQLVDVLSMYSTIYEYTIEDEIEKTRQYFINMKDKPKVDFSNITTYNDLIEHYDVYTDEQLFDLLIRWQYDNGGTVNTEAFNNFIDDVKEGNLEYEEFLDIRRDMRKLKKFYV